MPKKYLLLPFLTSLLFWSCYHPVNKGWLVWMALIPLLDYIRRETNTKRLLFFSWLSGFLFFLLGLWWLHFVSEIGLVLAAFIQGLYFLIFAGLARLIYRRLGDGAYYLSIPLLWTVLELARAYLLTGFPWLFLGHTQYRWSALIQVTDITGVYGLSFLIAAVNVFILFWLNRMLERKAPRHATRTIATRWGIILLSLLFATLLYGELRLRAIHLTTGPRLGLVQANIPMRLKVEHARGDVGKDIYLKHLTLSWQLLPDHPDLIVWAETMFPYNIKAGFNEIGLMTATAQSCGVDMLIGAVSDDESDKDKSKFANSAYLISRQGELLGRYDKVHLVPVSEAVPLRDIFPWLEKVVLDVAGLQSWMFLNPGQNLEPFKWRDYRFGVLVCYESIFPELCRASVAKGAQFIINVSNDAWFRDGAELEQILAISVFRAVENRVGFVRATNSGISAFITPTGQVKIYQAPDGRTKEVAGTFLQPVMLNDSGRTFYNRWGDYFPFLCLGGLVVLVIVSLRRRPSSSLVA